MPHTDLSGQKKGGEREGERERERERRGETSVDKLFS
jgi:hypothetical protein